METVVWLQRVVVTAIVLGVAVDGAPGKESTQSCSSSCPAGSYQNSNCECVTDNCRLVPAEACESVKCGDGGALCGLGLIILTSGIPPEEPPDPPQQIPFCDDCGCCSTAPGHSANCNGFPLPPFCRILVPP